MTRQVAALDSTEKGHVGLASYYTERGETPGHWVGSGMARIDGLSVGDEVTAQQMQSLFGSGLHPLAQQRRELLEGPDLSEADLKAVTRLGVPFKVFTSDVTAFQIEVAKRIEDHAASLGHPRDYPVQAADRARIRPGESVLMHSASGGIGSVVSQVAAALGAGRRIGTVGRPDKIAAGLAAGLTLVH